LHICCTYHYPLQVILLFHLLHNHRTYYASYDILSCLYYTTIIISHSCWLIENLALTISFTYTITFNQVFNIGTMGVTSLLIRYYSIYVTQYPIQKSLAGVKNAPLINNYSTSSESSSSSCSCILVHIVVCSTMGCSRPVACCSVHNIIQV